MSLKPSAESRNAASAFWKPLADPRRNRQRQQRAAMLAARTAAMGRDLPLDVSGRRVGNGQEAALRRSGSARQVSASR